MIKPENAALAAHALFFNPAYMTMRLAGAGGPKHYPTFPGAYADTEGNAVFHYIAPNAKSVEVGDFGGDLLHLFVGQSDDIPLEFSGMRLCLPFVDSVKLLQIAVKICLEAFPEP